ncbi:MAG: hypothetical protein AAF541_11155 [Pseudomonadota bacterium]
MREIKPPKAAVDAAAKGKTRIDNRSEIDLDVGPVPETLAQERLLERAEGGLHTDIETGHTNIETDVEAVDELVVSTATAQDKRTAASDRRMTDRRRSARGLFEILARREQGDRRQLERRGTRKFKLAFWRT